MMIDYNKYTYTIKDLEIDDMINIFNSLRAQIMINNLTADNAADKKDSEFLKLNGKINESLRLTISKVHKTFGESEKK